MALNRKLYVTIATGFCLIAASCLSHSQALQRTCISAENFESLRSKLVEAVSNYQNYAAQKLKLSLARLELRKSIQRCESGTSASDDLFDALALKEPKCNREIREHNALLDQEQSISSIMDMQKTLAQSYSNNLKMYDGNICR
jgi:hypothetical protein